MPLVVQQGMQHLVTNHELTVGVVSRQNDPVPFPGAGPEPYLLAVLSLEQTGLVGHHEPFDGRWVALEARAGFRLLPPFEDTPGGAFMSCALSGGGKGAAGARASQAASRASPAKTGEWDAAWMR